jgi:hypothetical protein
MNVAEVVMIGMLCFVFIALICTLVYIFQPKYKKSFRMFEKKVKEPKNSKDSTTETSATTSYSIEYRPIMKGHELTAFERLSNALRNKGVFIIPKINFSDFVQIKNTEANAKNPLYSILPYLKADFLLCSTATGKPLCIVRNTKTPMENANQAHMKNIATALKIQYIEVEGIDDKTIVEIYNKIR